MQTDRPNKIFSILKNTSDCLILRTHDEKFFRKTFVLKQQSLKSLIERQKLTHSNLINLHQLQFSHFINREEFAVEIVFDHYCRTLNQCILDHSSTWDDSEIINTFEPIIEVIDYLLKEKVVLNDFSLNNVAITESQDIKYIDAFLLTKEITQLQFSNNTNNFNQHKIYGKIAESIFSLVFPKQSTKVWKNRMKVLREKSSKQLFEFMSSILAKSQFKGRDVAKIKRIKKSVKVLKNENIDEALFNNQKQQKLDKDRLMVFEPNLYGKHQGKENKLMH